MMERQQFWSWSSHARGLHDLPLVVQDLFFLKVLLQLLVHLISQTFVSVALILLNQDYCQVGFLNKKSKRY